MNIRAGGSGEARDTAYIIDGTLEKGSSAAR
jgi:hypothetical protein